MRMSLFRPAARLLAGTLLLGVAACGTDSDPTPAGPDADGIVTPPTGATEFVSADGRAGQQSEDNGFDADAGAPGRDDAEGGGGSERTVEEGDIYRLLDEGRIVNLNAYRGLQVIDVSDVANPEVVGRLPEAGSPVELYVVEDRAVVLMNNWRGYYGERGDIAVSSREGGMVLLVDLSDPTEPTIIDRGYIPGFIQASRVTRGGGQVALYVATSEYGNWETADGASVWETRTFVKSFDVSGESMVDRSQIDLGGYVTAIQATPEALMVARQNWERYDGRTSVALIDISAPDGTMVEGQEVVAAGTIDNKYNMDVYNGVLRIVSGANWSGTRTNHVQTWDASDYAALEPIDECTFGDGENLFATLFLGNKAFFVTYLRVDPFHAFEITDDGRCIEHNEYIVSGWNEFFRPVLDETRLVGIGVNDEGSQTLAVSLYDITDLTEPEPMLARAEVAADWGWSEALWDDRAFSVIEGATSVLAPDGETVETGIILLPYTGWNDDEDRYFAGVQLYTFSADTLTRRGQMFQGTPVRRSFLADDDVTANLGDAELTLFDTEDPDEPTELGRVDLAPNFVDLITLENGHGVRVRGSDWYSYGGEQKNRIEVVSLDEHTDRSDAIASFEVPAGASIRAVGTTLTSTTFTWVEAGDSDRTSTYETTIEVWDLSDPAAPVRASTVVTRELQPSWGGYYYDGWGRGEADCFDCGGWWGYSGGPETAVAGDALVFLEREQQSEFQYRQRVCSSWPRYEERCVPSDDEEGTFECTYVNGYIQCVTPEGGEEVCTGSIQRCTYSDDTYECVEVDPADVTLETNCWDNDYYRYWTTFDLHVLDLREPASPALSDAIELPTEDEGVGILADGTDVWVSYRRPYEVEGDSRGYVRYFVRALDVANPAEPVLGAPVNVPGTLIAADGDTLYTQDTLWGEHIIDTAVARLELHDGLAYLQAIRRFPDQDVHTIKLDGAGNLLVSHRLSWLAARAPDGGGSVDAGSDSDAPSTPTEDPKQTLTVLDAASLAPLGTTAIDTWASLQDAQAGRALFSVPGGLLVVNLDSPATPWAQAWFPTQAWPWNIRVDDGVIRFAAGRYGIYEFALDTYNLLPPL